MAQSLVAIHHPNDYDPSQEVSRSLLGRSDVVTAVQFRTIMSNSVQEAPPTDHSPERVSPANL
jgi:hypothetical protein